MGKNKLPPGVKKDMLKGGKTLDHSPLFTALTLLPSGKLISKARSALQIGKKALRKDWRDRTLKDDTYYEKEVYGIEPKGLEGWRPLKAFTPKMLKTGPTQAAENALKIIPNKLSLNKKKTK